MNFEGFLLAFEGSNVLTTHPKAIITVKMKDRMSSYDKRLSKMLSGATLGRCPNARNDFFVISRPNGHVVVSLEANRPILLFFQKFRVIIFLIYKK